MAGRGCARNTHPLRPTMYSPKSVQAYSSDPTGRSGTGPVTFSPMAFALLAAVLAIQRRSHSHSVGCGFQLSGFTPSGTRSVEFKSVNAAGGDDPGPRTGRNVYVVNEPPVDAVGVAVELGEAEAAIERR